MKETLKKYLLIGLGWFFVLLALIGVVLPLLPTTLFLIFALALFAKSSPRFHQMLLDNKWFGSTLRQWETDKTMPRSAKHKATVLIVATFSLSIYMVNGHIWIQLLLVGIAVVLLFCIWRIKEQPAEATPKGEQEV